MPRCPLISVLRDPTQEESSDQTSGDRGPRFVAQKHIGLTTGVQLLQGPIMLFDYP